MKDINIAAEKREISTKGAVNELRRNGSVPGVLYSKESDPVNITVTELSLKPIVYTKEMHLVNLKVDGNDVKVILKDIQFDPLTDRIIHVDFQAITVGQVIQVQLPVSLIGQAIGVKNGGVLQQIMNKLDVECLPRHIPEQIEINIADLDVGDSVKVSDLEFEDLTILNAEDTAIVAVTAPKGSDEEEATDELGEEEESAEPEVISKGKSEDEE